MQSTSQLITSEASITENWDDADWLRSRAMAVASSFGFFAIFRLKEAHEITREIESSHPACRMFEPFLEVRVRFSAPRLLLTSLGTIHKNGWNHSKNGFSATPFAHEKPGYAAPTGRAEKWNLHPYLFLGYAPGAGECETKSMQWPETTIRG